MKFINYLTSITGVGIFPLISLLVFFAFFLFLGFFLIKADKNRMNYLATMPIDDTVSDNETESQN